MKAHHVRLLAGSIALLAANVSAAVFYVDVNSTNATPPYADWSTAATNIQDAVDAATNGDLILVTNGIYQAGGRLTSDGTINRVAVTNAMTLRSINGPALTSIDGGHAMRCVYATSGAVVAGFTLTNGNAGNGGGAFSGTVSNCVLTGNSAVYGGGAYSSTLDNCVLASNSASGWGGGVYSATLLGCTLSNNSAPFGGGSYSSALTNCTLSGNFAVAIGGGAMHGALYNCTLSSNICGGNSSCAGGNCYSGGGAFQATLTDCTLSGNSATNGGGAALSTLNNCTLNNNWASVGGGVESSTLNNCTLSSNGALVGGGADSSTLSNCTLISNYSTNGGGANSSTLNDCILTNNTAFSTGGGACSSTLSDCLLLNNAAGSSGGGAAGSTLNNCTVSGNSAEIGGGMDYCVANNCIVYYNNAPIGLNFSSSMLNSCCSWPQPSRVSGNITNEPVFADLAGGNLRLQSNSPCINMGDNLYATNSTDLDGNPRVVGDVVDMGAYEFQTILQQPLSVAIQAPYTSLLVGFGANFNGIIRGQAATSNRWVFGDGTVVNNQLSVSHSWASVGTFPVLFWAYNDANPAGVSATVTVQVSTQAVYYVNANGANPDVPYTSWGTAARNIQDAADVAIPLPGSLVLVTNGTYQAGGRVITSITNRLAVTKPIAVQSVNGPAATIIEGCQIPGVTNGAAAVRCAYLTNGAVLAGFWLTNGATAASNSDLFGGGVYCVSTNAVVSNCVITANSAVGAGGGAFSGQFYNCSFIGNRSGAAGGAASASLLINCILSGNRATSGGGAQICTLNDCALYSNSATGGNGGGAINSTLNNCILSGNSAYSGGGVSGGILNNCLLATNSSNNGGGAFSATLINCTLALNSGGEQGGGVSSSMLKNCIVYGNSAVRFPNYYSSVFTNCCTLPLPANGLGNISNAPAFVDLVNGDFHLQSNSPCINSGNNADVAVTNDLDGNPRIVGGTVDIGAYEYQNPVSVISYAWLQQYGLPIDTNTDTADPDGDGMNNYQEWIAGTVPTNALSVLQMLASASTNNPPGLVVSWQSVSGVTYFLQSSSNLGAQPAFSTIQSNIVGQPGTTSYTDTTATNAGPYFYRVGVQQ